MSALELPRGHSLRRLGPADLPALLALHEAVMASLPDPSLFRLFGGAEDFLRKHFGPRGESLGIVAGERLLAYGALTRPAADDRDNYANDLGWPGERAGRVALLSAAMVDPARRGQGLHTALIHARIELAARSGVPELLVRAAPANAVSRRTLLEQGFAVVWLGVQAEGSLRHILWRPVSRPACARPPPDDTDVMWIDALDQPAQQQALAAGRIGACTRVADAAIGYVRAEAHA
ncbi:hypothetical protein GCM10025771_02850 [Niveibacterium umoris]|uniref:GNAT superfamily N-acetyltransferase n=1 Tax=Niveibacterium umoris TaxID=1193620 RepID=A0A840BNG2_9RHOO|nr:GNAT family N-acetyltransferase [Niveibacterium umoris]MBB4014173.1 GNAT superfamily N-acetyltransferase [Niveibacterium umoris]